MATPCRFDSGSGHHFLVDDLFLLNWTFLLPDGIIADPFWETSKSWSRGEMRGLSGIFNKGAVLSLLLLAPMSLQAAHSSVHDSVARNDIMQVRNMLKRGISINKVNRYDEQPLHLARTPEMIELLIKNGADVNIENHFGDSPLMQAVLKGEHELVELLIKHGANINHKNRFGDTPLQEAVNRDLIVMAKILIDNGADVNAQGKHGDTVLHTSVRRGNHSMARVLVQSGAEVDIKNDDDRVALDLAVGRNMKRELVNYKIYR